MRLVADIPFVPGHDHVKLDLMLPEGAGPWPVVVVVHGGGWFQGHKEGFRAYGRMLDQWGIASVIPSYRLTGEAPHPAQYDDVRSSLDWIAAHADEFSLDADRVGMIGGSSGGHLVDLVAFRGSKEGTLPCNVRCAMTIAAPTDLLLRTREQAARGHGLNVARLVGGSTEGKEDLLREISPTSYAHAGAPALLAVHGDADEAVPLHHSSMMVDALRAAGAEAELLVLPGQGHGALRQVEDEYEPSIDAEILRRFFVGHLLAD